MRTPEELVSRRAVGLGWTPGLLPAGRQARRATMRATVRATLRATLETLAGMSGEVTIWPHRLAGACRAGFGKRFGKRS